MAVYPIKMLKDENNKPFLPLVSIDGIMEADGQSIKQDLDSKLEPGNIIAGDNIEVTLGEDNNVTITAITSTTQSDKNYYFQQSSASDTWVITHNLEKYPSVTVIDSAGNEVMGDVVYNSINQITIHFKGAFKGSATLN